MRRSFIRLAGVACVSALPALSFVPMISSAAPATAPAAAPTASPDTPTGLLASKGLDKAGTLYVLGAEKDVAAGLKEITKAKADMDKETKDRIVVEKQIKMAKGVFSSLELEYRTLNEKLGAVKDVTQNNQIVGKINAAVSKMKEAQKFQAEQEKKLASVGEEKKAKYVNLIIDLGIKNDKAYDDYKALGADGGVKGALDETKTKLGPSPEFVANTAQIKRLRGLVTADTIDVEVEGGVPHVQVTINGNNTRTMVFDSGASLVCLPADMAKALEIIPAKDDPIAEFTMADGKIVKAPVTKLKSVRVGSFTINDVECAILPPDLVAAPALLGGSFLQHFTYKMDTKGGKLHLAQVSGIDKDKPGEKKPGAK